MNRQRSLRLHNNPWEYRNSTRMSQKRRRTVPSKIALNNPISENMNGVGNSGNTVKSFSTSADTKTYGVITEEKVEVNDTPIEDNAANDEVFIEMTNRESSKAINAADAIIQEEEIQSMSNENQITYADTVI